MPKSRKPQKSSLVGRKITVTKRGSLLGLSGKVERMLDDGALVSLERFPRQKMVLSNGNFDLVGGR